MIEIDLFKPGARVLVCQLKQKLKQQNPLTGMNNIGGGHFISGDIS